MKTLAAVLVETGRPLELVELDIPALKPGQALVEILYSGVCHTQLLECRGQRGADPYLPHCLGHEGSGTVLEVGEGVRKVAPGNRVILSWIKGSGTDAGGTVYGWAGRSVNAGGITTFSRLSVISENRLTAVPDAIPMEQAAYLGCAIPTGVGSVINTAAPSPGQSVAVFGAGGVGLCAVQGAAIAGCVPIIAIDIRAEKLPLAVRMGATHTVLSTQQEPLEAIRRICPQGLDYAVEATGRPQVMMQALQAVRNQGGIAVVIGNAPFGERLDLDPWQLNLGKQLRGTWGGDTRPDRDFPRYCRLLETNRLDVRPLQSPPYPLSGVNQALDDLEAGRAARPLIDMKLE
jgi:S-(hydroxymethyl)glutathione dehydrogenase/alcohol dehydrogenase